MSVGIPRSREDIESPAACQQQTDLIFGERGPGVPGGIGRQPGGLPGLFTPEDGGGEPARGQLGEERLRALFADVHDQDRPLGRSGSLARLRSHRGLAYYHAPENTREKSHSFFVRAPRPVPKAAKQKEADRRAAKGEAERRAWP